MRAAQDCPLRCLTYLTRYPAYANYSVSVGSPPPHPAPPHRGKLKKTKEKQRKTEENEGKLKKNQGKLKKT